MFYWIRTFMLCKITFALFMVDISLTAGWSTFWRDDFNGPSRSLPTGWKFNEGHQNFGTGEIEYNTKSPDNVCLDGQGNLKITPLKNSKGQWTSARIETLQENFRPPRGGKMAIEGRIIIPNVSGEKALGYWPAFWALGSPLRHGKPWPSIGEFDVLESVNGLDKIWGTVHCGVSPGGPCHEPTGLGNTTVCKTCKQQFHIYRFEWDETTHPAELRWYLNGHLYNKVTSAQMDSATWASMTDHSGYFIILDVAMGGSFPDGVAGKSTPTSQTEPGHSMYVDYIAVFTDK